MMTDQRSALPEQLSQHFTLAEMTVSQTAIVKRLDNNPLPDILARLIATAAALEAVRSLLGQPIHVNSGYRSVAVNTAVGGVPTSAHCLGYAVDFTCPVFGTPYDICKAILASDIKFDQLIHEYGTWAHISFDPRMRNMPLTIASARIGYLRGILPIKVSG